MPCRASICDNSAAPLDGRAVLSAPSSTMAASSGLDATQLLALATAWVAGARFADARGACRFGHTDAAHANATESAPFFATEFSAGACIPLSSCRWGAAHFVCTCVSEAKAHALVAHHARHHAQLAAATLLSAAAAWLLARRARAARHPAFVALVCLGGLLLLRGSAPLAPAEGYWQGCGAEAEAATGGLRFRSLAGEAA
ncbi:hypothetical protein AB1Y20_005102 [Prymnesium parvum]|uniref:Uncharacterized protein n=1 Tax=Prymnesium parvum TaxID=97485 RepID=A0AB34J3N9_PRYPA